MDERIGENAAKRLDRLERENWRLKRIFAGGLLVVAAAVLMGQMVPSKVPSVVEAQKFLLKDLSGKVRGAFGTTDTGEVTFAIFDRSQKAIIEIGLHEDGPPYLYFSNSAGQRRFVLTVHKGVTGLGFVDQNLNVRASLLYSETDNAPRLSLSDKDGKERALFELGRDGDPRLDLYDQYNRVRINIGLQKGTPLLFLRDETGKTVWGGTSLK